VRLRRHRPVQPQQKHASMRQYYCEDAIVMGPAAQVGWTGTETTMPWELVVMTDPKLSTKQSASDWALAGSNESVTLDRKARARAAISFPT
jgi:hypothetical protein